jgi:hypothetical protein
MNYMLVIVRSVGFIVSKDNLRCAGTDYFYASTPKEEAQSSHMCWLVLRKPFPDASSPRLKS